MTSGSDAAAPPRCQGQGQRQAHHDADDPSIPETNSTLAAAMIAPTNHQPAVPESAGGTHNQHASAPSAYGMDHEDRQAVTPPRGAADDAQEQDAEKQQTDQPAASFMVTLLSRFRSTAAPSSASGRMSGSAETRIRNTTLFVASPAGARCGTASASRRSPRRKSRPSERTRARRAGAAPDRAECACRNPSECGGTRRYRCRGWPRCPD
jgi:hypothetical protein